jgi:lipoprotein-anchoring transpeptidase ErfK/SrfK
MSSYGEDKYSRLSDSLLLDLFMPAPTNLSRRNFIKLSSRASLIGMGTILTGCNGGAEMETLLDSGFNTKVPNAYTAIPSEPFPLPAVDTKLFPSKYERSYVNYTSVEPVGTVIVDVDQRYLYLLVSKGKALRYGVSIGKEGFLWKGRAYIGRKKAWPTWTPPAEMVARRPDLQKYANGMPPSTQNPLGARALYIYKDGKDTLYRFHGTPDVPSIGKAASSGCIRMINQDVIDLYNRVPIKAPVIVY